MDDREASVFTFLEEKDKYNGLVYAEARQTWLNPDRTPSERYRTVRESVKAIIDEDPRFDRTQLLSGLGINDTTIFDKQCKAIDELRGAAYQHSESGNDPRLTAAQDACTREGISPKDILSEYCSAVIAQKVDQIAAELKQKGRVVDDGIRSQITPLLDWGVAQGVSRDMLEHVRDKSLPNAPQPIQL